MMIIVIIVMIGTVPPAARDVAVPELDLKEHKQTMNKATHST